MANSTTVQYRNGVRAPATFTANVPITFGCDLDSNNTFNEATDGEWIAANDLSWADGAAFADWAALRPFTELEFEKAARGGQTPVANEYAWGDTTISAATTPTPSGMITEKSTLTTANCVYGNTASLQGPLRVGGVAGNSDGTRSRSGASYYGVMELSGNLWERPVTVGNTTGRAFTGLHGDGALDTGGLYGADVTNWPTASGSIRGGDWTNSDTVERTSDRFCAATEYSSRGNNWGARLARTAP